MGHALLACLILIFHACFGCLIWGFGSACLALPACLPWLAYSGMCSSLLLGTILLGWY
jgi:hypothetical protein